MSIALAFRPMQEAALKGVGSWSGVKGKPAYELRVLTTPDEIKAALQLRYRAYTGIGYDVEAQDGVYRDRYDDLPTTVMLGAYDKGNLVGAVRLCFSHPWQSLASLPCAGYYPALKDVKRSASGPLVEISRLSIEPSLNNTSYRTTLYGFLVRAAYTAAQAARVSTILIATRPEWVKFYRYMLAFEQIGVPAFYPPGDFKITLLGGSLELAQRRQKMQNRFFMISEEEIKSMAEALAPALSRAPSLQGDEIAAVAV